MSTSEQRMEVLFGHFVGRGGSGGFNCIDPADIRVLRERLQWR